DCVNHRYLTAKLRSLGICDQVVDWIQNWLSDRTCRVQVGDSQSLPFHAPSGVPQGSVLGPILFLVYINDLDKSITHGTSVRIFADDVKLIRPIQKHSEFSDYQNFRADLAALEQWAAQWQMTISSQKCEHLSTGNWELLLRVNGELI